MKILIQNEAQCNECLDIIVSKDTHDFVSCSCGKLAVDGGMDYTRRLYKSKDVYTERSLYIEKSDLEKCVAAVDWAKETKRNSLGTVLAVIRALRDTNHLDLTTFE